MASRPEARAGPPRFAPPRRDPSPRPLRPTSPPRPQRPPRRVERVPAPPRSAAQQRAVSPSEVRMQQLGMTLQDVKEKQQELQRLKQNLRAKMRVGGLPTNVSD